MTTSSTKDANTFKVGEVGFFYSSLPVTKEQPDCQYVATGKDVIYRDVNNSAKRVAKGKSSVYVAQP